ncbi:MAG: DUF433 domain-containing protein [Dehalococcoidales bacterium]|nr:DUF433 domain-containing protein [Dehalococcoidales bacterium]
MIGIAEQTNRWRTRPVYTIIQAAKLAAVHPITVRRWLYGSNTKSTKMRPVFFGTNEKIEDGAEVSFLQLAEIVVVSRFRQRGVKLNSLRQAHEYACEKLSLSYPFAWLHLKTDSIHVFSDFQKIHPDASLLTLDKNGQLTLPGNVIQAMELFDYEDEFASRWYPIGRTVPIVIDPRYGAGRPTIPQRRLPVASIYNRWKSGEKIHFISTDYALSQKLVETALQYAESYAI